MGADKATEGLEEHDGSGQATQMQQGLHTNTTVVFF
jgi:hypothetical protein